MRYKFFWFIIFSFLMSCSPTAIRPLDGSKSSSKKHNQDNTVKISSDKVATTNVPPTLPKVYKTLTRPNSPKVIDYCKKVDRYFKKYNWGPSGCETFSWHHVRSSYWGNPIVWFVFGKEPTTPEMANNTTMIFCAVHGDEITPVKFCYDVLHDLKNYPHLYQDKTVVIAPIVTPDSFFRKKPTRTNARGVDVNRNFPTKDWNAKALKMWKYRYGRDKRRYPGKRSLSEQETHFQINLIKRYNPHKVISVHAPLTLLDYDGPAFTQRPGASAKELLLQMSDSAGKYKVSNYPFFPGSLGNWAGNERNIPTITLELPNSDWNKTDRFFKLFKSAIHHAINHNLEIHTIEEKVSNSKKTRSQKKRN